MAAALLVLIAPPASARSGAEPDPILADGSHISVRLDAVAVDSPAYRSAQASYDAIVQRRVADQQALLQTVARVGSLRTRGLELTAAIRRDTSTKATADRRAAKLRTQLLHLAIEAYTGYDEQAGSGAVPDLDADRALHTRSVTATRRAVTEVSHRGFVAEMDISRAAADRLEKNGAMLVETNRELADASAERERLTEQIDSDVREEKRRKIVLRQARATAIVRGSNLPLVALDAYVHAADLANGRRPSCNIRWALLAGIGQIESHQGTSGGAQLLPDGRVSRPIVGVALDGTSGNERILAAGGAFARAEGPMQFIPSTWAAFAQDGDDDGRAEPQNLYDAAATAATYLCRGGRDLATAGGQRSAILSYNFSGAYVSAVQQAADGYASALPKLPAG